MGCYSKQYNLDTVQQSYVTMSFGEMECLVCATGLPTFEIVVWCWRTGQKLASHPTGLTSLNIEMR